MSQPGTLDLDMALRRVAARLRAQATTDATAAASGVAADAAADVAADLDAHAAKRQFVHGVGPPFYVAKTRNATQYVDWAEIQNKPATFPSAGPFDPDDLELDGEQIATGTVKIGRLPVAAPGVPDARLLVRADDPRLSVRVFTARATESLAQGDWVSVFKSGDTLCARKALASDPERLAVGYVQEGWGVDQVAEIWQDGLAHCTYALADGALVGARAFLSDTTPGRVILTPPLGDGSVLQVLGDVVDTGAGWVGVLARWTLAIRDVPDTLSGTSEALGLGDSTPLAPGVPAAGVSAYATRADHVHPRQEPQVYSQLVPEAVWCIVHDLGYVPVVTVLDSSGYEVVGDVRHVGVMSVEITFSAAFAGTAYLH